MRRRARFRLAHPRDPSCHSVAHGLRLGAVEIRQTSEFSRWLTRMEDKRARGLVEVRIRRLSLGLPGDVRPIGEGVSELRIDFGPGYRVYFCQRGQVLVILLIGGDKRTQARDIRTALRLAREL